MVVTGVVPSLLSVVMPTLLTTNGALAVAPVKIKRCAAWSVVLTVCAVPPFVRVMTEVSAPDLIHKVESSTLVLVKLNGAIAIFCLNSEAIISPLVLVGALYVVELPPIVSS